MKHNLEFKRSHEATPRIEINLKSFGSKKKKHFLLD